MNKRISKKRNKIKQNTVSLGKTSPTFNQQSQLKNIDQATFQQNIEGELSKAIREALLENEVEYFRFVKWITSDFEHLIHYSDALMNQVEGKRGMIPKVPDSPRLRTYHDRYKRTIEQWKEEISQQSEKNFLEKEKERLSVQSRTIEDTTLLRIIKCRLEKIHEKEEAEAEMYSQKR